MKRSRPDLRTAVSSRSNRTGTVQMELALFLPLYATLLMVLFTICSFSRTRQTVMLTARHDAWLQQAKYGNETESVNNPVAGTERISMILNGEHDPTSGLISGHQQQNAQLYLKTLQTVTQSQSDHFVLTDPWDFRVLRFETEREHSRLTMGDRIPVFGNIDRQSFMSLLSASDVSPRTAAQQMQSIQNSKRRATSHAGRALQTLQREIQQLQQKTLSLQVQLDNARNQTPPDDQQIAAIDEELKATQDKLTTMKSRADRIEEMNKILKSL